MSTIMQQKRGTASQWTSLNPVLYAGEFGWESDTNRFKIGNGTTAWNSLPYASPALGQGIPSGGTTGQILAKNSATNYDTVWTDVAPSTSVVKHLVKLGESINKGQAVYVSSANGTNIIVSKASNASEATSSKTMGLLQTGGTTNAEVYVVVEGLLSGLDTSTANAAGDPVWLGTNGNLIYGLTNKPYGPAHLVFIGIVTRVNQNNGEIFVKPQNGFELQEIHNIGIGYTTPPSDKDLLVYESSTSLWKNKSFSTLGLATSSYVDTSIANLVASAPATLDTLNELAAALGNDASFATTVTNSLAGKANLTGGNTFSGAQIIGVTSDSAIPLQLRRNSATSTANIQEWDDQNGNVLSSISASGTFSTPQISITGTVAGNVPLTIIPAASQSVDTFRVRNSANSATLFSIASNGGLVSSTSTIAGFASNYTDPASGVSAAVKISGAGATAGLIVGSGGTGIIPQIIRATASQSADLIQIQDSNANILIKADSVGTLGAFRGGYFSTNFGTTGQNSALTAQPASSTVVGLVVRGAASQTANLLELQNSSGGIISYALPNGDWIMPNLFNNYAGIGMGYADYQGGSTSLYVRPTLTTRSAMVIKGLASQSANLQEWQNSSGTILGSISASGAALFRPVNFAGNVSAGITLQDNGGNWIAGGMYIKSDSGGNPRLGFQGINTTSEALSIVGGQVGINTITPGTLGSGSVQAQLGIVNGLAAGVGLVVRGAASQTANLQEWQNSSGTILSRIGLDGALTAPNVNAISPNPSYDVLTSRAVSGQTGNLLLLMASDTTAIGGRNRNAQIWTGSVSPISSQSGGGATTAASGTGTVATITTTNNHNLAVGDRITVAGITPTGYNGTYIVTAVTSNTVSYANTTTGAQTVAGTISVDAQASITARSAGTIPLVLRAATNQGVRMLEIQGSAGSVQLSVDAGGVLSANGGYISQVFAGAGITGGTLGRLNVSPFSAGQVGEVVRGVNGQTANLSEWQTWNGTTATTVASISNIGNLTVGANLTFTNPGVGNETKINFSKTNDSAWLAVTERSADATTYEFGMSDNPDGGDHFQWRFNDWQNPGTGWMPIQITGYTSRFIARLTNLIGNVQIPYNTGFYTYNNTSVTADNEVNKYFPTNSTTNQVPKSSGTGTGTLTVNASSFTGTGATPYWVTIDGAGTFKWGTGSNFLSTPVATGVAITGSAQTLSNGLTVTLSLTGHVLNDMWSFSAYPTPQFAIGTGPFGSVTSTIWTRTNFIGQVIRGSSGQTANLQEWQTWDGLASTIVTSINSGGLLSTTRNITIAETNAGENAFVIRGAANHTGYLSLWTDSSSVVDAGINAQGQFWTGSTLPVNGSATVAINAQTPTGTTNITITTAAAHGILVGQNVTIAGVTPAGYNGNWIAQSGTTGTTLVVNIGSNPGAITVAGTVSQSAQLSITPASTNVTGLVVKGAASQAVNLQEWQDSSGTAQAFIRNGGNLGIGPLLTGTLVAFNNTSANAGTILQMRASSSQVGDQQQWQASDGTILGGRNRNAQIFTGSTSPIRSGIGGTIQSIATGANPLVTMASNHNLVAGDLVVLSGTTNGTYDGTFVVSASTPASTTFNITTALTTGQAAAGGTVNVPAQASITSRSGATVGLNVRGASNQTASFMEVQNSTATTTLFRINATGYAMAPLGFIGGGTNQSTNTSSVLANNTMYATATGQIGLAVRGILNQSANIFEVQDSAGSSLAFFNNVGRLVAPRVSFGGRTDFTGSVNFFANNSTTVAAIVQGANGQSVNLQEWQSWDGTTATTRTFVASNGSMAIGNATTPGGWLGIDTTSTGGRGIVIKHLNTTSNDVIQLQNSSGTIIGGRNGNAQIYTGSTTPLTTAVGNGINGVSGNGTLVTFSTTFAHNLVDGDRVTISGLTPSGYNGTYIISGVSTFSFNVNNTTTGAASGSGVASVDAQSSINIRSAGTTGLIVRGASSQVSNLQEWQNSAGTVLTSVTPTGIININNASLRINTQGTGFNARINVSTDGTGVIGQVIRATSGQTANLQEWQDSTGTMLSRVTSGGSIVSTQGFAVLGGASISGSTATLLQTASASRIPVTIQGAASQTANLTEWQDSTGATLARVNQNGIIIGYSNIIAGATTGVLGTISSYAINASTIPLVARGVASQSADLQQWQDSAGTVLLAITSAGGIGTSGLTSIRISSDRNVALNSNSGSYGGGQAVTFIGNATTAPTSNPTGGGILYVNAGALTYRGTSGSAATIVNADGTMAGGSFTGGTLTSDLVLAAGSTTVEPLTFQSNSSTPTTTSGAMDYDGTVFYQTANTNPGRALNTQNYYYVSSADYGPDFSTSASVQSMLGAATRGITVAAGTTYEYELYATIQHQYVTNTGITGTYQITSTTVSGSPTVAVVHQIDYGSNTTGFTTATTLSSIRTTSSVVFSAAISSGSRFNILRAKGIIRVTGTGTTKIYPGLSLSAASGDNIWTIQNGLVFKLTPVGNGTVTTVGAWA